MRTYHDEPTHAKIFIEFIALIIRNKIYTCLKDRMKGQQKKKNYMTVTATQKDILQAFNITEAMVKKEAGILGKKLKTVTN